jgi:uncharacterized protein YqeY
MSLLKKIDEDLIKALKAGEKEKTTVLRGLKSDLKYKQIEKKDELTDEDVVAVLNSCVKKIKDSIEQFEKGGREDLVAHEKVGLEIMQQYLPDQLGADELRELVTQAVAESGAKTPQQIGLVMKVLMPKVRGRADGKEVNRLVTELLSK